MLLTSRNAAYLSLGFRGLACVPDRDEVHGIRIHVILYDQADQHIRRSLAFCRAAPSAAQRS
jgi:hypothetical protein